MKFSCQEIKLFEKIKPMKNVTIFRSKWLLAALLILGLLYMEGRVHEKITSLDSNAASFAR